MLRLALISALAALVACAGPRVQTVQFVNKTPRTIEQFFVFPPGAARGASRGKLAPNGQTTLKLKDGVHEIYAVSARIVHDDNTRETPEASMTIELRGPLDIVFYDSNAVPSGIDGPNTRAIKFVMRPPSEPTDDSGPLPEPEPEPAPQP
ncbi:MAG: hypothetical protein AB7P03_21345 [Kofleriaceae bacterium]